MYCARAETVFVGCLCPSAGPLELENAVYMKPSWTCARDLAQNAEKHQPTCQVTVAVDSEDSGCGRCQWNFVHMSLSVCTCAQARMSFVTLR